MITLSEYLDRLGHGSAKQLAEQLGVSSQVIHLWRLGKRPIPPKKAVEIFLLSNGIVGLYDMRPDVFTYEFMLACRQGFNIHV